MSVQEKNGAYPSSPYILICDGRMAGTIYMGFEKISRAISQIHGRLAPFQGHAEMSFQLWDQIRQRLPQLRRVGFTKLSSIHRSAALVDHKLLIAAAGFPSTPRRTGDQG